MNSDAIACSLVAAGVFCASFIILLILHYRYVGRTRDVHSFLESRIRSLQQEYGLLESRIHGLQREHDAEISKLTREQSIAIAELEHIMRGLQEEASAAERADWIGRASRLTYRNEIEVEVKFIYPLLCHLGYDSDALEIRRWIAVQVGRSEVKGEADWVVWDERPLAGHGHPRLVIEAKDPRQELTEEVRNQARSYAFALGAPTYALINGERIQIFSRGVQSDSCLFDCRVSALAAQWSELEEAIGKKHDAHPPG